MMPVGGSHRGELTVRCYLAGHAIQYLAVALNALTSPDQFRYLGYAGCLLQAITAALLPLNGRLRSIGLLMMTGVYVTMMAVYGAVAGNWYSYIAYDVITFALLFNIVAGSDKLIFAKVGSLYEWLLIPGTIVAGLILVGLSVAGPGERFVSDRDTNLFYIVTLCAPGLFLLVTNSPRARWRVAITGAALAIMLLFGVITATRGAVLVPVGAVFLAAATAPRRRAPLLAAASMTVVVLALVAAVWTEAGLASGIETLGTRFDPEDFSSGRNNESEIFRAEMRPVQWWVGRGLGGSYFGLIRANEQYGINMVHYGYLHLILKGGVVLLLLVSAITARGLQAGFSNGGDRGAAAYLIVFGAMNIAHTQFSPDTSMAFFALAIGRALSGNTSFASILHTRRSLQTRRRPDAPCLRPSVLEGPAFK